MKKTKRRQRYAKGTKPLTAGERDLLANIPGWTPSRWERSSATGTRKARRGYEARIRVAGKDWYGPSRQTRTLARTDYEDLRTAADESVEVFDYVLTQLRAEKD